jgi:hypothetical protein
VNVQVVGFQVSAFYGGDHMQQTTIAVAEHGNEACQRFIRRALAMGLITPTDHDTGEQAVILDCLDNDDSIVEDYAIVSMEAAEALARDLGMTWEPATGGPA